MKRNLPFFNFGLRWNKSVYVLASSDGVDKYSLCAPCTALIYLYVYTDTIVISLTLICIHVAPVIPPSRLSENDILFPPRSHSSVKQPSLCWNYDSPSGMRRPVPRRLQLETRNEQGRSPGTRLPGRPTLFRKHPSHPPSTYVFVHQGQGTKCWVIPIKLSGWKRLQMLLFCVWFCLLTLSFFSLPWILSALAARALGVCVFKKLKKRGLWKRSWGLGFCYLWITVFLNCLWLNSQKYKVNRLKQMDSFLVAPGSLLTTETLLFVLFTINSNIY